MVKPKFFSMWRVMMEAWTVFQSHHGAWHIEAGASGLWNMASWASNGVVAVAPILYGDGRGPWTNIRFGPLLFGQENPVEPLPLSGLSLPECTVLLDHRTCRDRRVCRAGGSSEENIDFFFEIHVIRHKNQGDTENLIVTGNESLLLSSAVMWMKSVRLTPAAAGREFCCRCQEAEVAGNFVSAIEN
jgi:hypothetical protein